MLYYVEIISWELLGLVVALLLIRHQILHIVCFIGNSALSAFLVMVLIFRDLLYYIN